jgi:hypothetical protein
VKVVVHKLTIPNVIAALLLTLFLLLDGAGCANNGGNDSTAFQVVPVGSRDVAVMSSDDVVRVMRRSGFSDEQILVLGTQVRNALLLSGAVEIKRGKIIEVIFAVNDNNLFITTRLRGNFIYNIENGTWVGLENIAKPPLQRRVVPSQPSFDSQTYLNQPTSPNRYNRN